VFRESLFSDLISLLTSDGHITIKYTAFDYTCRMLQPMSLTCMEDISDGNDPFLLATRKNSEDEDDDDEEDDL